jgi:GntR family transcriptional regulator
MNVIKPADPKSPTPPYLQIVEQVRRLLAVGALRPGDRFLTVRALAARARVNRNTAGRVIASLERSGIVRTQVGRGTFIADRPASLDARSREAGLEAALERLAIEAHVLGVPPEELGWRLQRTVEALARSRGGADRS